MRKHKWRRRLFLLVVFILIGVIVLTPDRTGEKPAARAEGNADIRQEAQADPALWEEDRKSEESIVGWMIDRIAAGEVELSDEESIRQALQEAEQELEISLTQDHKNRIVGFLKTLGTIGVETEDFIEQAREKYQTYSEGFVEEANEAINEAVEGAVASAARNFADNIRQAAGDFFKNLIPE